MAEETAKVEKTDEAPKKKSFKEEFIEFISRGSVVDLAVGVVVGGAFTAIVNSLVNDIIMPLIGWIFGGFSVADQFIFYFINPITQNVAEIRVGSFLQSVLSFLIIALSIFLVIKGINRLHDVKDKAAKKAAEKIAAKKAEKAEKSEKAEKAEKK